MILKQVVWTDTTEECGAVVSVPPNTLKKSLRAVRETLCGAASDGEKRGAWDHGLAACIVALRSSGAPIPIRLSAKRAHPFVPLAGPTATARSGGHRWSKDRCPHPFIDGRAPGETLVEDSTTVHSWIAGAGLLPGIQRARMGANLHSKHISAAPTERSDRNARAFSCPSTYRPECAQPSFAVQSDRRSTTRTRSS
jgi:hypothetical protein